MAILPPFVGPREGLADLRAFLRQRSREQRIGAILAFLVTAVIVVIFFLDSKVNTAPPARVIYAESWSADRTDAEIVAQQKKDQAAREAALLERQRQFQRLEKRLGIE